MRIVLPALTALALSFGGAPAAQAGGIRVFGPVYTGFGEPVWNRPLYRGPDYNRPATEPEVYGRPYPLVCAPRSVPVWTGWGWARERLVLCR